MIPGFRILLIDDDEVDRARVLRALRPEHEVCEAATAAKGKACIQAGFDGHDPDVVLLDLRLPDADGLALLPWFTDLGLPVVMLTGVSDMEVAVETMRAGALDYIVKGNLTAESLERALQRAVETAALRRAVADHQAEIARQRDQMIEQADALAVSNREIRALASALTLAEQAERRRISALLHDHVQQLLFGAQILLEGVQKTPEAAPFRDRILRAYDIVGEGIEATRQLALGFTPPVLDADDFSLALRWLATHVHKTYALTVEVEARDPVVIGDREVRVLLTELVRELLFNVVKHARVDRATVHLRRDRQEVVVVVSDAGAGFDPSSLTADEQFGLYSVRRRLELLGGRFEIASSVGRGTRATLWIAAAETSPLADT